MALRVQIRGFHLREYQFYFGKLGGDGSFCILGTYCFPSASVSIHFRVFSYLIDVYRRDVKAETSFADFRSIPDYVPPN